MKKKSLKGSFPVEEYQFIKIPDEELDACYYYEFSREKSELIKGIKLWRKHVPQLAEIKTHFVINHKRKQKNIFLRDPIILPDTDNDNADALMPKCLEKYTDYLVNLIATFPEFPDAPWQSIPNDERKKLWAQSFKAPTEDDFRKEPHRAIDDVTELIHFCEAHGRSLVRLLQRGQSDPHNKRLKVGTRLLNISWKWTNKQIMAAFEGWLATNRPSDYPEPTIGIGRGIDQLGSDWTELSQKKRTALECLGVYRRKKMCSWNEYLDKWPVGYSNKASEKRRLQAQKKVASKIIASFKG